MVTIDDRNHSLADSLVIDFDKMAEQMRLRLRELEARANDQTRDLQTVAQVSQQIATLLNLNDLLPQVVELTKTGFELYHVHIYLFDEAGASLKLAAGAGEVGRAMVEHHHSIAYQNTHSLVARAARDRQGVLVDDVTLVDDFLPNPLLPATRSEMAIPLMVGDQLLGVLDVQAAEINRFGAEDLQIMSTLAAQVSVAVQNAQAFSRIAEAESHLQLYVDLVNSNPIGMYVYQLEQADNPRSLRMMAANEASFAATGVRPETLIGKTMPEIFPGLFETQLPDIYVNIIRTGEGVELGEVAYNADGVNEGIFLVRAFPLPNSSLGVSFENITERKKIEEEIHLRANDLEVVAQVSAEAATKLDVNELLNSVVNLTKERFNLYHAHIYLLDEASETLVLTAGSGEAGRTMVASGRSISLRHEHSLVARAAREGKGVIVNDVTTEPDFLAHPLLPDTQSEMAIPMIVGSKVIGVMDVQADILNRFTAKDVRVKTTLASQVAVAVQNARLFAEAQLRLRDLQVSNTISEVLRMGEDIETTLESVLSVVIETMGADNAVMSNYDPVTNLWHGFVGAGEGMNSEIARSFTDPGERYPHGLEVVETGNLVAIDNVLNYPNFPMDFVDNLAIKSVLTLPVYAGSRVGGVIFFNYNRASHLFKPAELSLAQGIANQISVNIERKLAEEEVITRAAKIETVANVGAQIAANLNMDELLWSLVNLTKERFNRYHVQIYLYEGSSNSLILEAGSGEVGKQLVQRGHSISMTTQNSLVARTARERTVIVVEDTHLSDGFLANLLLPETRSEMTLPLVIGDQLLGVLDIQDNRVNTFTQIDVQTKTVLANQIAVALQNARSFQQVEQAREEADRVFNTSIDMLGSATFEGYFTRLNPAWEKTLGFKDEELKAQPFLAFVHPDDVESTIAAATQLSQGQDAISFENRYQRKDGSYRWISWNSAPDTANGLIHFVARDITAGKEAEAERGRNASLLRTVLDSSPDWIFVKDTDFRYMLVNNSYAEAIGCNVEEVIGKDDLELGFSEELVLGNPDKGIRGFRTDDVEVLSQGKVLHNPYDPAANADGMPLIFDTRKTPLRNADNEIFGILGFAHDITERLQSQQAIEASRQRAEILAAMTTALSQATTEDEILAAVAIMAETYGVSLSSLVYVDTDESHNISNFEIKAARSAEGHVLPLTIFPKRIFAPEEYPLAKLIQESLDTNLIIQDMSTDPRIDENSRDFANQVEARSGLIMALQAGNKLQGLLTFNWKEANEFSSELLDIMESIRPSAASTLATRRAYLLAEQARLESENRAHELAAVAEVSAQVTATLDVENLLQQVADLVKERFDLYHAHVYLLDDSGQQLVLAGGAGEAGRTMKQRGHSIALSTTNSIVARAARERQGVIVNDVTRYDGYLPNPFLPQTRSEMSIPMIVANQLIGILDVQSEKINRFDQEDMQIKSTLAAQVAVAVQNARSFAEMERQADRERETSERLREVDRLKSQFLANMSHELRTPLNSIIGYAEVLLDGVDGDLEDEAVEDVNAIYDSGRHLLSIINEILDLAKIEAGQMQLDRKPVDLTEFAAEIVKNGQILLKTKPVTLTVEQESFVPPIYADPIRLRQIIWNLVSNAVKFTEQGSVTVCYGRADDENVYVKVVDSGIGMSDEGQRVIFERFSQVDGSSTRRAGGTGLGLTITQQLVHMHGGEIVVESVIGKGSIFSFTMPVYQDEKVAQGN